MDKLRIPWKKFILLIAVFIIASSTSLKANDAVTKKPPEMWLTVVKERKVPESIQLRNETDFVIESNVLRVKVACESEYPITLESPYLQNTSNNFKNTKVSHYRISNWRTQALMPVNIKFKWVIEIPVWLLEFISVNVTCVPVDRTIKTSKPSVHLYWKGKQSIEIQDDIDKRDISPFTNATKSTSSSYYEPGFNFVSKSILNGSASAAYQPYDSMMVDSVKCCSGIRDKPPKMYVMESYNQLMAQIARNSILKDIATGKKRPIHHSHRFRDCYQAYPSEIFFSMLVVCQGQNIDFAEEFTYAFCPGKPNNRSKVANKSEQIFKNNWSGDKPEGIPDSQLLGSADLKTAPISQKLMLTVLRREEKLDDNLFDYRMHFCDKQVNFTIDSLSSNRVNLREYDRDLYYDGEELIFMCLGGKFLYANGAYLKLSWKNGTKNFLIPTPKDYSTMPCGFAASGIGGFVQLRGNAILAYTDYTAVVKFGRVVANREMASMECLIPHRDGTEWDTISNNLTILSGVAPKFAEMENEVVDISKGEKGKSLVFTVNQGLPVPIVTISKDGLPLITNMTLDRRYNGQLLPGNGIIITSYRDNENEFTVFITFPKVKSNHTGVYECKASNRYKTVTRTINVSVIDETSTTNKDA